MVYIMNESGGDFQQGGLPVQANQWDLTNTRVLVEVWQASEKADWSTFGSS